ncbi:MAG: VIT1/CCC1 transporter family protein [Fimbriimonadales bacterium]|nr:VIT1/CCC1 transporter family protein [Fimbriimonadales bacterium]
MEGDPRRVDRQGGRVRGAGAPAAALAGILDLGASGRTGGMAEVVTRAIAMGQVRSLARVGERGHCRSELRREEGDPPPGKRQAFGEILWGWGLGAESLRSAAEGICIGRRRWSEFPVGQELGLQEPNPTRAVRGVLTIGVAVGLGGAISPVQCRFEPALHRAPAVSVVVTLGALLAFGGIEAKPTGISRLGGAARTALVGGLALGAAIVPESGRLGTRSLGLRAGLTDGGRGRLDPGLPGARRAFGWRSDAGTLGK